MPIHCTHLLLNRGKKIFQLAYVGVNYVDIMDRQRGYHGVAFPLIPGLEVSGWVHELGEGAGGVGTVAGQQARVLQAGRVLGTVGQEQKFAYARSFGYDQVFLREGFVEAVRVAHQRMESATNTGKILLQVQS